MTKSELNKLGEKLSEMILSNNGTEDDEYNVAFKYGQYCHIFGTKEENVDILYKMWENKDVRLNMEKYDFAVYLIANKDNESVFKNEFKIERQ